MFAGFKIEETKEDKIKSLRKQIIKASDSYYNSTTPIMSDDEFDNLKIELEKLSPNDLVLKQIGSKVKVSEWEVIKHNIAMGSLNKVNTIDELSDWIYKNNLKENLIISEKLDGISIDLEYNNGILIKGITRGDGITGENIFSNVKKMRNIKTELDIKFTGSIRGEIIIINTEFDKINEILKSNDEKEYTTLRNATNGIAKRYDGKFSENLDVIVYDITGIFNTKEEQFYLLKELGFKVVNYKYISKEVVVGVNEVYQHYENTIRKKLDYQIDGLVIETNNREIFNTIGMLNDKPRGAIALKFDSMKAETILNDVVWEYGNSGRLTPIAEFNVVQIQGRIKRASLHNYEIFRALELHKGDKILIKKANDIIPQVVKVIQKNTDIEFDYPKTCPICGEETKIDNKYLICSNINCHGKQIGNIKKWCSSIGIQSKGIGEKLIERLYNEGLIKNASDLYRIKEEDISKLERYGDKSASNIIEIIQNNKEIELSEFIAGLNIPNFGKRMAEILIENGYDSYLKIEELTIDELIKMDGIEEKTATTFINGYNEKEDLRLDLIGIGVKIKTVNKDKKLSFCFTGAVQSIDKSGNRYTRSKLIDVVNLNGGEVFNSVKSGLDYLVMADPNSTSTKAQKARKLGINLIGEEQFFNMFGVDI